MKIFRRFVGHQLCPRCESKQLPMVISGKLRKDGSITQATLTVGNDSNPACLYDGEKYSITSDQARKLISAAELKEALAVQSVENNQPSLF